MKLKKIKNKNKNKNKIKTFVSILSNVVNSRGITTDKVSDYNF